ncbi:MAG: hypothetical protein N3F03_08520, partial [Ignavibacteria bacterium]|nr:hypothetical protein [Ignavibacteria bacterium]
MKTSKILLLVSFLIILFGCSKDNPVSNNNYSGSPILIATFKEIINLIDVNNLNPKKIVLQDENFNVLFSTNGGLNFQTLALPPYEVVRNLCFDNKIENQLYIESKPGEVIVDNNFGSNRSYLLYGDIGRVNKIYPTKNDTLVLIYLTGSFCIPPYDLFWLNRKNLTWNLMENYRYSLISSLDKFPRGVFDISDAIKDNKHFIAISDLASFGIIITEDNFQTINRYQSNNLLFLKHDLNEDGSWGIALTVSLSKDTILYKSSDMFKSISPINSSSLVGVSIKDFFFINKNTLLLYGKNRAGKSVILLSTPDFNNFNTILEVEG